MCKLKIKMIKLIAVITYLEYFWKWSKEDVQLFLCHSSYLLLKLDAGNTKLLVVDM